MKTNGTRILIIAIFLYLFLLIISFSCQSQPDYNFKTSSLISGTDKLIGAKYRFTNVKTGVDAIVIIANLTNGLTLADFDGPSGFAEAFQPVIDIPAGKSGYAEFKIDFVVAGTIIPMIMPQVPITCIDVDGQMVSGLPVKEYDMISISPGSYCDYGMLGGELAVSFAPGWSTGRNTGAIDYPSVDTMAKQVMFSMIEPAISTVTIRVGADNQTTSSQNRLRSVYFKKFTYNASFLSQPALRAFRGSEKNKKVELQWELITDNNLKSVIVEKGSRADQFQSIGEVWLSTEKSLQRSFRFNDNAQLDGNAFYRLKMVSVNGIVQYSNVLAFREKDGRSTSFKVYPSAIQSTATIQVRAERIATALFQLVDYSGRVVHQQQVLVQAGNNNIQLNNFGQANSGNYLAVLKMDKNNIYNQKVFKQ